MAQLVKQRSYLTAEAAEKMAQLVERTVYDLPTNTQNTGKMFAYTQVAIALMQTESEGIPPFIRAVEKKLSNGWGDIPWVQDFQDEYHKEVARHSRVQ